MLGFFLGRALLPQILFFILLGAGWYLGRLWGRRIQAFLAAWLLGVLAAVVFPLTAPLLTGYVAMLDVVLILVIFRADIRI